jgi:sec-independent protein translocase protein TatB
MFGISAAEVMIIMLVALVVLGPDRLPVVARKVGQVVGDLRKVSAGFEAEMRSAMLEPDQPPRIVQPPSTTTGEPAPEPPADDDAVAELPAPTDDPA